MQSRPDAFAAFVEDDETFEAYVERMRKVGRAGVCEILSQGHRDHMLLQEEYSEMVVHCGGALLHCGGCFLQSRSDCGKTLIFCALQRLMPISSAEFGAYDLRHARVAAGRHVGWQHRAASLLYDL